MSPRIARSAVLSAALAMVVGGALWAAGAIGQQRRDGFPHDKHAKVAPTCTGCHAGISTGEATLRFPTAASCAECHDGVQEDSVTWRAREPRPTLLRFAHDTHRVAVTDAPIACQGCHAAAPDTGWMRVHRAAPANCLSCHEHRATEHLAADNVCTDCHRTLTDAPAIPLARVADFPKPPSHEADDFISKHKPEGRAALASCATCHARESCARCHVNVQTLEQAQSLQPDARVRTIVANRPALYPIPETHDAADFDVSHGALATRITARCTNCHTQTSCRTCHLGSSGSAIIAKMPVASPGTAPGVKLELARPVGDARSALARRTVNARVSAVPVSRAERSRAGPTLGERIPLSQLAARADTGTRRVTVHPIGFDIEHGGAAASGELRCEGCHEKRWCADCHGGEGRRRYHLPNFVARHAPEAYGAQRDCAQCHNAEVFCRSCHVQNGLGTRGRLDEAYHTAQLVWLLQHGRAARSSLESCTTCHTQRECMQCHSGLGLRVNPHGRDFKASRLATKNRDMCFTCHLTDPLVGR
ncbi:MAG: cytochrome c family protein [Gemmatimonadaceae bacterium]|jgi:hypothetical protein|nr:cytochrome c family protein [Gemmatimonadaceae bacterium]